MRPQMSPPYHVSCSSLPSHRLGRPFVILLMLAVVVEGTGTKTVMEATAAATTTTNPLSSASSSSSALSWSPLDAIFAGLGIGESDDLVADGSGGGVGWEGEGNAEEEDGWEGPVSTSSPSSSPPSSSSSGPVAPMSSGGNDGNGKGSGYDDQSLHSPSSSFLSYIDDDDDNGARYLPSSPDSVGIYLSTLRARTQALKTRLRTSTGSPDGKIEEARGLLLRLLREGPAMVEELTVTMLSRLSRAHRAARSWHQMLRLLLQESFDRVGSEKDDKVEQKVRVTQAFFYTAIGVIVVRLLVAILSAVWVVVKAVGRIGRVVVGVLKMKWVRWGLMGLLVMWLVGLM